MYGMITTVDGNTHEGTIFFGGLVDIYEENQERTTIRYNEIENIDIDN